MDRGAWWAIVHGVARVKHDCVIKYTWMVEYKKILVLCSPRADLLQNGLVGSPCSPRDSQESFPTPQFKSINSSALSHLHSPTLTSIHDYWKTIALTRQTLVGKVISLLLNVLSRLVITFLPRSKRL